MSARGQKGQALTEREQRFVEAYAASGNGTHSARVAGYAGSDDTLAQMAAKLKRRPRVSDAIIELARRRTAATEVTRERRLEVLSQIVEGEILAPIGIANGKPVYGPPSHDARRKAAMDVARMKGELLDTRPAVDVNVNTRSVHVVVMVPPSKLGPTPPGAPALEPKLAAAPPTPPAPEPSKS